MPKDYLVSAIVSVYNCERFIAGCLEDLEQQTIAGKLEIVVVNSGSQQNEEAIIKKFQEKYDNIVYIKTENRETIYQAWNRGIKATCGKYITNANSDDRHRKDAFEIMVNVLENDKNIDLVYYDFIVTETENEIFDNCTPIAYQNLPEFDEYRFIRGPSYGHQPMWRKVIHNKVVYFDGSFEVAGDYEFWIRLSLSEKCKFKHIKEYLGLYLKNPNSLERRNAHIVTSEILMAIDKHILDASNDKKIFKKIKKRQSKRACALGYMYLKKKQPFLALKTFLHSFLYNWFNLEGYKGIFICFLPTRTMEILMKAKKTLKKTINNCNNISTTYFKLLLKLVTIKTLWLLTKFIKLIFLRRFLRFLIVKLHISSETSGIFFLTEILKPKNGDDAKEIILIGNISICLDLSNKYEYMMYYGYYEPGLIKIMKKILVPGSTFIDVGANIGYISAQAAIQVGRNGVVYSFEPVPEYFLKLKEMTQKAPGYNIIVNQCAVGDKENTVEIRTSLDGNTGWNTIIPGLMSATNIKKIIKVPLVRLGKYIDYNKVVNIAMIKIDVEGAEFLVLKGLEEFFVTGNRPPIFCEVCPKAALLLGASVEELFSYMSKFGYNSYIYEKDSWYTIQWRELLRTEDILWMQNSPNFSS